jgi:hypothetical protein
LTDVVAAMNSGIRVRESIPFFVYAIDARGRSAEGRSMDRDLGTPKKSQESAPKSAIVAPVPAGLPMKQTHRCMARSTTRNAASSKAHDKDATYHKEFCR